MQDRLRQGPGDLCRVANVEFRDYSDTKIKLHFSHFKLLVRYFCLRRWLELGAGRTEASVG